MLLSPWLECRKPAPGSVLEQLSSRKLLPDSEDTEVVRRSPDQNRQSTHRTTRSGYGRVLDMFEYSSVKKDCHIGDMETVTSSFPILVRILQVEADSLPLPGLLVRDLIRSPCFLGVLYDDGSHSFSSFRFRILFLLYQRLHE